MTLDISISSLTLCRLLIDAAVTAVGRLSAKGGRWEGGHLSLKPSRKLKPGLRVGYWLKSAPLIRLLRIDGVVKGHEGGELWVSGSAGEARAALASTGGMGAIREKDDDDDDEDESGDLAKGDRYFFEVGIDNVGKTVVRHLPPLPMIELRAGDDLPGLHSGPQPAAGGSLVAGPVGKGGVPGEVSVVPPHPPVATERVVLAPPDLRLDSAYVNVDELLLRSASHLAAVELLTLRMELERKLAAVAARSAAALCSARLAFVQVCSHFTHICADRSHIQV